MTPHEAEARGEAVGHLLDQFGGVINQYWHLHVKQSIDCNKYRECCTSAAIEHDRLQAKILSLPLDQIGFDQLGKLWWEDFAAFQAHQAVRSARPGPGAAPSATSSGADG